MAFTKVKDVIAQARILLQDTDASGYRFDTAGMVQALNEGLLEARKLRPDLFRYSLSAVPQYIVSDADSDSTTLIAFEQMYIPALVNYVCGRVQLRDDESTTDARAGIFLTTFVNKLTQAVA